MKPPEVLINRDNYLLSEEYLDYLLNQKQRKQNTTDSYRFWLRHLLLWAIDKPLEKAHAIKPSLTQYAQGLNLAPESRKKIIETSRAFLRWCKLYYAKRFDTLPAYWLEDLTPDKVKQNGVAEFVSLDMWRNNRVGA